MSRYRITIESKGLRRAVVDKLVASLEELKGEPRVTVQADELPTSRADRLDAALSLVSDAASEVESLRDELQEWYDNLPENFQNGDKGEALQSAIDELDEILSPLQDVDGSSVEFPGMY